MMRITPPKMLSLRKIDVLRPVRTRLYFWGQPRNMAPSMRRFFALGALLLVPSMGCDKIQARDLVREGNQLYSDGLFSEAISKYDEAESLEPDGVTYLWNRACANESIVLKLKDAEKPEDVEARNAAATRALADFQTWYDRLEIKTEGDAKALEEHKLALLAVDQRCDELLAHWQNELKEDPKNEGIYVNIAKIHEDPCGQPDEADAWFKKRTEDFPESSRAWYELAVRSFEPLMPDPESGLPYNANVNADERMKIADEVIGYLNTATKLAPQNRDPYVWRAMAYTQKSMARVYLDPPETPEDKIELLNKRNDAMLAWKEQKAVCDIDQIQDCPLDRPADELLNNAASYTDKEVGVKGKIVADSIKPIDAAKHVYGFDFKVLAPESQQPPKPAEGEPKPAPVYLDTLKVEFTVLVPQPAPVEEGEAPQPVDPETIKAKVDESIETWKKAKSITIYGKISADKSKFVAAERPMVACCPEAPLTAAEVEADKELRAKAEAEIAAAAAEKQDNGKKKRRGR